MKNKKDRKGIVLAGGKGSRLSPITSAISKQLLLIYDKPMIYYPISNLLMAGIKEILIICDPLNLDLFRRLLKDGSQWGVKIEYKTQESPDGIAQSFILGEEFLDGHSVCLILGDNLFYGDDLWHKLMKVSAKNNEANIFAYQVRDPYRYGIVEFNEESKVVNILEKPPNPKTNYAVTGIYFYSNSVVQIAKELIPSKRGELEITDINKIYLEREELKVNIMGRGMAWFDTGTFDSLSEAGAFIKTLENRQGLKVGCPEEVAYLKGFINKDDLKSEALKNINSEYGKYLLKLADSEK